jgi:hypothetical protein
MEAGPKQRPRQYSVRKLLKTRGSAEFGLNRLSQPHCAPLLRGFCQDGGDEGERHRHPNRALTLVFPHGERLDGLGRVDKKFVEPAASVVQGGLRWQHS